LEISNKNGEKGDIATNKIAYTRLLTQIIIYLTEIKQQACITELNENLMNKNQLPDALNWLVANKILCRKPTNLDDYKPYFINPKWKELRNELYNL
jgi:hypothetical protein